MEMFSIFSQSKKNSSYLCDFCDICYFFIYTFLIAVFFKSFLLKFRKQFARKKRLQLILKDIDQRGVFLIQGTQTENARSPYVFRLKKGVTSRFESRVSEGK